MPALWRQDRGRALGRGRISVHKALRATNPYLAQRTDKTTVTKIMRVARETVGKIKEALAALLDSDSHALAGRKLDVVSMLLLCCGGIHAYPAHIYPFWTH